MRKRWGPAAVGLLAFAAFGITTVPASAADGVIDIRVVRDVNSDGAYQADLEVGVKGLDVKVYDANGKVAEAVTGSDGTAAVNPDSSGLSGGKYRVEAVIPPSMAYLKPAPAGATLAPLVTFVDTSAGPVSVTMGVHNPADYAQANPPLAAPIQHGMLSTQEDPTRRALLRWPYEQRGMTPKPEVLATQQQIGSVYGLAWQRSTKSMFAGALAKRFAAYGPLGSGGIYKIGQDGTVTPFATVPDAGSSKHGDPARDADFFGIPGKEGLGDLDVSEDDKTLYAVNLNTKSLVAYDTASGESTGTYPITNPCAYEVNWRPYGLAVHDGKVFVGGVCAAGPEAHIYAFDPAAKTFAPFYKHSLTFNREALNVSGWNAWLDTWDLTKIKQMATPDLMQAGYAQPILADLEFDRDGSMILGFRDRFGDQGGHRAASPDPADNTLYAFSHVSGDINRVCRTGDGYAWEGETGCVSGHSTRPGVAEFYAGDIAEVPGFGTNGIGEDATGSLAFAPRFSEIVSTVLDPTTVRSAGVGFFDNQTGAWNAAAGKWYLLYATPGYNYGPGTQVPPELEEPGTFGKGGGLGDLELLADPAPLQIGDRVWNDTDADGLQDPAEPGVPGARVALECTGAETRTTTTDASGGYLFDAVPAATECTLRFDAGDSLQPTTATAGDDRRIDSNIDRSGATTFTTGAAGENDHTLDAGYTTPSGDPELGITITGGGADCACGEVPLEVVVTNSGTSDAEPVAVEVPLPSGVTLRPSEGWTAVDGKATAKVANALKPGESAKLPLVLDVPCTGVEVMATIVGLEYSAAKVALKACAGAPDVVVEFPEPEITKCKGNWICGSLEVRNDGSSAVDSVEVGVDIPAGLTLAAEHNPKWTVSGGKATTTAGPLKPGESTTLKLILKVTCDVEPGSTHTLTATAPLAKDAKPADNTDTTLVKIAGAKPARCA